MADKVFWYICGISTGLAIGMYAGIKLINRRWIKRINEMRELKQFKAR